MFLRKTKCRNDEKSGRRRKKLLLRPLPLSCLLHLIGLILLGLVLHNNAVQSEEQPPEAEIVMETAEAEMPPEAVPEEQKQDTSSSEQQETPKPASPEPTESPEPQQSPEQSQPAPAAQPAKRQNRLRQKINRPRMQKYRNLLKLPTRPSPQHHHRCPLTRRRRRLRMWKAAFRCRQGRPLLQPRAVRLRPQRLALEKDRRQVLPARRTAAAVTMALQLLPAVLPILRILLLAPAVRKATPTSPRVLPPTSRPIKNIRILPSALAKQAA